MAFKASDVLARVQSLGYATDTEPAQLNALDQVQRRVLNTRRWRFLYEKDSSKELTTNNNEIELQALSDTKRVDAVRLEFGEEFLELEHQDYETLRSAEHKYRETGLPEWWAVIGQKLHVWPIPDKNYKVVIDYVKNPTIITAAANTLLIPDSHIDILVWGIVVNVTFRERDWEGHNFARQMYAEHLAEMMTQYGMTDRQTSDRVVESGFYDAYDVEPASWLT